MDITASCSAQPLSLAHPQRDVLAPQDVVRQVGTGFTSLTPRAEPARLFVQSQLRSLAPPWERK